MERSERSTTPTAAGSRSPTRCRGRAARHRVRPRYGQQHRPGPRASGNRPFPAAVRGVRPVDPCGHERRRAVRSARAADPGGLGRRRPGGHGSCWVRARSLRRATAMLPSSSCSSPPCTPTDRGFGHSQRLSRGCVGRRLPVGPTGGRRSGNMSSSSRSLGDGRRLGIHRALACPGAAGSGVDRALGTSRPGPRRAAVKQLLAFDLDVRDVLPPFKRRPW